MVLACALQVAVLSSSAVATCIHELNEVRYVLGYKYLWFVYVPMYFIARPVVFLFVSLIDIIESDSIAAKASHVPAYYAPQPHADESFLLIAIVLPTVAAIFGALHLIAWGFQFPPHERLLWRIGSLTITAIPTGTLFVILSVLFIRVCLKFVKENLNTPLPTSKISPSGSVRENVEVIFGLLAAFLAGAGLVAYMLARLLLLAQAVVLLSKQPDSAFYAIDWTHFFPHL